MGTTFEFRGIDAPGTCSLCGCSPETLSHALFTCTIASSVWAHFLLSRPMNAIKNDMAWLPLYGSYGSIGTVPVHMSESFFWQFLFRADSEEATCITPSAPLTPFTQYSRSMPTQVQMNTPVAGGRDGRRQTHSSPRHQAPVLH